MFPTQTQRQVGVGDLIGLGDRGDRGDRAKVPGPPPMTINSSPLGSRFDALAGSLDRLEHLSSELSERLRPVCIEQNPSGAEGRPTTPPPVCAVDVALEDIDARITVVTNRLASTLQRLAL